MATIIIQAGMHLGKRTTNSSELQELAEQDRGIRDYVNFELTIIGIGHQYRPSSLNRALELRECKEYAELQCIPSISASVLATPENSRTACFHQDVTSGRSTYLRSR